MVEYKICEVCNEKNDIGFTECIRCTADISFISPSRVEEILPPGKETDQESEPETHSKLSETRQIRPQSRGTQLLQQIKLIGKKDGVTIEIPVSGCMLGREGDVSPEYFDTFDFISRTHASIVLRENAFMVVDQSRNGTWVNKKRVPKGIEYPITIGDILRIADLEFLVEPANE